MTVIPIVIGASTVLLSAVLAALAARRAAYERVMAAVTFVSEGTVATARHEVGALMYDQFREDFLNGRAFFVGPDHAQVRSRRIEDLFTILWAATRLNAVKESLGPRLLSRGPHGLLRRSLSAWVSYWIRPDPDFPADRARPRVNALADSLEAKLDEDDLVGLRELERAWQLRAG